MRWVLKLCPNEAGDQDNGQETSHDFQCSHQWPHRTETLEQETRNQRDTEWTEVVVTRGELALLYFIVSFLFIVYFMFRLKGENFQQSSNIPFNWKMKTKYWKCTQAKWKHGCFPLSYHICPLNPLCIVSYRELSVSSHLCSADKQTVLQLFYSLLPAPCGQPSSELLFPNPVTGWKPSTYWLTMDAPPPPPPNRERHPKTTGIRCKFGSGWYSVFVMDLMLNFHCCSTHLTWLPLISYADGIWNDWRTSRQMFCKMNMVKTDWDIWKLTFEKMWSDMSKRGKSHKLTGLLLSVTVYTFKTRKLDI